MVAHHSLSDIELADLLKSGDHNAYTEIYNRYNGLLYVFAYKRLRNREETKDLIHELFLTLWAGKENLSLTNSLQAYLYSATRNRIINLILHRKVEQRYIDSFKQYIDHINAAGTDHLIRHNELNSFIEKEIAALSPRMRQIFEMSRKTNLTRQQIAEQLNISPETVKSQMHSAIKQLKVKLGPLFYMLF